MTSGERIAAVAVSRETRIRLDQYRELLKTWSAHINLVSAADQKAGLSHHIDDSLSLIPHIPTGVQRILDLGSGGGFPAIPVALASGLCVDMIEADRRKAAFLQTALAILGLPGKVWCERIETTKAPSADCITAKALAPLEILLPLTVRLLTASGTALFLKGPRAQQEIELAALNWHMTVTLLPGASNRSQILKITHLRHVNGPDHPPCS